MNPKKYLIWLNLYMGVYNMYLYVEGEWLFNLFVGSLNIGVWVWNRDILFKSDEE